MPGDGEQELVRRLAAGRESLYILQNMLQKERWFVEQKLRLAAEAKQSLDRVLHGLTGDDHYRCG